MLKVTTLPMINVREASAKIAQRINPDAESIIFVDICECLTDTDSLIVPAYLPEDEESFVLDYDIECQTFFKLVKEATGLSWGDEFLADLE